MFVTTDQLMDICDLPLPIKPFHNFCWVFITPKWPEVGSWWQACWTLEFTLCPLHYLLLQVQWLLLKSAAQPLQFCLHPCIVFVAFISLKCSILKSQYWLHPECFKTVTMCVTSSTFLGVRRVQTCEMKVNPSEHTLSNLIGLLEYTFSSYAHSFLHRLLQPCQLAVSAQGPAL